MTTYGPISKRFLKNHLNINTSIFGVMDMNLNGISTECDRNRAYTWLMAPLEATLFADYAWKVPDRQKANWRLYYGFS